MPATAATTDTARTITDADRDLILAALDDGAEIEDVAEHMGMTAFQVERVRDGLPDPAAVVAYAPESFVGTILRQAPTKEPKIAAASTILGRLSVQPAAKATSPAAAAVKPAPKGKRLSAKDLQGELRDALTRGASAVELCQIGARAGFDADAMMNVAAKIATPATNAETGEVTWTLTSTLRPAEEPRDRVGSFGSPGYAVSRPRFRV